MVTARGLAIKAITSDEERERINIKFHNENVAIEGFGAYRTGSGTTLTLETPLGYVDIEMTANFVATVIAALQDPQ